MKFLQSINIVFLIFALTNCKVEDSATEPEPNPSSFAKLAEYQTDVPEPSGLTLDDKGKFLWTVSDNTNRVYKLDLQGNTRKILDYTGDDLEGIVFDYRDNTLWLAEERLRELVHIDTNGAELGRFRIENLEGSGNSGIEGVCLNSDAVFAVLNEKDPALWAKLDSSFYAFDVTPITSVDDLSGITFYGSNNYLIVSDQSQKLILWSTNNEILSEYSLDYEKAEGVAYDSLTSKIYIVSDKTGKLYVYRKTGNIF